LQRKIKATFRRGYAKGRGWAPAAELRIGDAIPTSDGAWVKVEGVAGSGRVETVYNLEVEEDHTYFVGSEAWGFDLWSHNAHQGYAIGNYDRLNAFFRRNPSTRLGRQSNHLNQNAVYSRLSTNPDVRGAVIPPGQGSTVPLGGGTATAGTQHNLFHRSLERFWDQYRPGGARFGDVPTNGEYQRALVQALRDAGFNARQAYKIAGSRDR
jgi:hypothetical protein